MMNGIVERRRKKECGVRRASYAEAGTTTQRHRRTWQ